MPRALITGITAQNGLYLAELPGRQECAGHVPIRGENNPRREPVKRLLPKARPHIGDLTDMSSLVRALRESDPDEAYNLGAVSAEADLEAGRQGR